MITVFITNFLPSLCPFVRLLPLCWTDWSLTLNFCMRVGHDHSSQGIEGQRLWLGFRLGIGLDTFLNRLTFAVALLQQCTSWLQLAEGWRSRVTHTHTHDRFTALCLDLSGWAGTRRNIHPLTPLLLINHPYHLPPSTTNRSIILAQSTYLAISLHNL